MPVWTELIAVVVCAISAVLAAEGKGIDLFGVMVLALVTAVGGGTIRDLCLGVTPVFWIDQPHLVWTALLAAAATFVAARFVHMPEKALGVADAFGLALFGIAGTEKALLFGSPGIVAVLLGIVTGVAGGDFAGCPAPGDSVGVPARGESLRHRRLRGGDPVCGPSALDARLQWPRLHWHGGHPYPPACRHALGSAASGFLDARQPERCGSRS